MTILTRMGSAPADVCTAPPPLDITYGPNGVPDPIEFPAEQLAADRQEAEATVAIFEEQLGQAVREAYAAGRGWGERFGYVQGWAAGAWRGVVLGGLLGVLGRQCVVWATGA